MAIKPSVGKKIRFKVWHDIEFFGKTYTIGGNGIDRPADTNEWTGEVVEITQRRHKYGNVSGRDFYSVKRDFDGFVQYSYANEFVGYVYI
ncbi:hypothetical protein JOD82_001888 [Paenibacillus sp. 1182]|uniref:hypothetical protein n=1 Tax=Paenibacillus sp. 1182 TaxID=2806565 RepID=UPI001AE6581A|nr:hypothetical protein [Paenibacillus sp. 1182]MBP1308868.1 hypothetical protein [Paenibacillus sp. 1182]